VRDPDGLVALRDALVQAAGKFGFSDALATGALWRGWTEIVGEDVAAHAEPTSLKDGLLRIRADSPVWATELGYLAEEIRSRINLNAETELVAKIAVWTGPRKDSGRVRGTRSRGSAETPDDELPDSPMEALQRAEKAWRKTHSGDGSDGVSGGPGIMEKPS
jgi:predicted nucleic acid-binding Zn ribbon protein